MRKLILLLVTLMIPATLLAQNEPWRTRPIDTRTAGNMFELTPFGGYRYGGTIFADQTDLFGNQNVDVASSGSFGLNFAVPVGYDMKLEFLFDRQNTHFTNGQGLFSPTQRLGGFDVTYFSGGLQIPFAISRQATPYVAVGLGVANLDPRVNGASSNTRFSANAGIGVKVPISRNLGIKIEERGYFTSMSNSSNSNCRNCYYNYDYNHDLYQGETNVGIIFKF
ncbi:MAG TPA: outer membrane beta-barrel protein [Thermoanaerobaculia bacterium]|nr:outer membrane beta-barrel protein [Thermoanaerobaculia bacterium]